jgi:hypothetical protein
MYIYIYMDIPYYPSLSLFLCVEYPIRKKTIKIVENLHINILITFCSI